MKKFSETRKEILSDPREAAEYLNTVIEQGDTSMLMVALRNVAEAQGGFVKIAKHTKLNRGNLYRILSEKGNPRVLNLEKLLDAFGLRLFIGVRDDVKFRKAA